VEKYCFKSLNEDGAILGFHCATHRGLSSVWLKIASLARRSDMTGGRIVVTNQAGEVVILVGVATARAYPLAPRKANRPAPCKGSRPYRTAGLEGLLTQS
jgi:hypothetical protein